MRMMKCDAQAENCGSPLLSSAHLHPKSGCRLSATSENNSPERPGILAPSDETYQKCSKMASNITNRFTCHAQL